MYFLLFMVRKLLRRKLTIPRKSDIPSGSLLLRCSWGPLLCIVEFVHRPNLVHIYHLGSTYLHTTCIHTDYVYVYVCYIWRICIMKNVVRCGLPNYLSLSLSLYVIIWSLAFCCYCCCYSLLFVFIHFVSCRSFLARRLDGFYGKFCKLFFTETVEV